MHKKDFDKWNNLKKIINNKNVKKRFFNERDVWFLNMGVNVGFEQDGNSGEFLRPVLILKKFSGQTFLGIPLTKTNKDTKFYHSFEFKKQISVAILSQIKFFDAKRLKTSKKYGRLSVKDFNDIKNKLKILIFK